MRSHARFGIRLLLIKRRRRSLSWLRRACPIVILLSPPHSQADGHPKTSQPFTQAMAPGAPREKEKPKGSTSNSDESTLQQIGSSGIQALELNFFGGSSWR